MPVIVDRETCAGFGNCALVAPDAFTLDDENKVRLVGEATGTDVERAAAQCPTGAITLAAR